MKLYSITNRTSAQNLGTFLGMDAADAIDAMACDAGYESQAHAAAALGTTVKALNADLVVAEYDAADDLVRLADAMVEDDRNSGECTADVLDDADAGSSDHWDASGVYDVAEEMGLSAATVDAIGWDNIRDAYAAAWRAAVELALASRDEVAAVEAAILLVSDVTSASYQDDGSYIIAIADDGGDDAARDLARIAAALPPGWKIDWTGNGDSDGNGYSTSDAHVWRDEVAS